MEFFIYATDEDHAIELAGNSADLEFGSLAKAIAGFDPDVHELRNIYRIEVERAWSNLGAAAESYSIMK